MRGLFCLLILAVPSFAGISRITEEMRGEILDTLTVTGSEIAIITMEDGGMIYIKFFPEEAPNTVKNFIMLSRLRFYDGLTFHRVIPGFVAQGGCPLGRGTGDAGYNIDAEFNEREHLTGTVAMARAQDPNSASCQFYICLAPQPHLDGAYTVFGQVIKGMEIVEKIEIGDVMESIRIETMSYNELKALLKDNALYSLPVAKKITEPVYHEKIEERVILRILVNKQGEVDRVIVLESVSPTIDNLAVEAVKKWRFTPAKIGEKTINDWVTMPVEFTITNR